MAREDVPAEKGASPEQLSIVEQVLASQQKLTKYIIDLLILVVLLLIIIASALWLPLLVEKKDAADAVTTGKTSPPSRYRRSLHESGDEAQSSLGFWDDNSFLDPPTVPNFVPDPTSESTVAPSEMPPSLESFRSFSGSIERVLNEGFFNLTTRFDVLLQRSVHHASTPQSGSFSQDEPIILSNETRGRSRDEGTSRLEEEMATNLKTLVEIINKKSSIDSVEQILNEGFFNLTSRFDRMIQSTTREEPTHEPDMASLFRLGNLVQNTSNDKARVSTNETERQSNEELAFGSNAEMASHMKKIVEVNTNISTTLDVIVDRFFTMDYRQPNYSCPNWNRGNYQYIGPDRYYSTCYYKQSNV